MSTANLLQLHQTGKLLRDQNLWNPRQSGITQKRINEFVPFANQQFHEALDEIESEIVRETLLSNAFNPAIFPNIWNQLQAKAVMERDLLLLQKKRIERERIAKGLKAQPSPEEATRAIQLSDEPPETSHSSNAAQSHEETNGNDTMMTNSGPESTLIGSNDEPHSEAPPNKDEGKEGDITGDSGMPHDADNSMDLTTTVAQDSTEIVEPPKSPMKDPSGATPGAEAPLDSSAADLDFESMFNDTDLTGGDDAMNFGLDFPSDGNLNQDVLNDSAFENIEMSNADISNLGATTSEDINTLLPGLENYVNAGTDFSNINIPILPTLPETSQGTNAGNVSATAQVSAQPAAAESSFDDIFGSGDYSMGGTGDDGLGAGTLGDFEDFDEDWFKTGS